MIAVSCSAATNDTWLKTTFLGRWEGDSVVNSFVLRAATNREFVAKLGQMRAAQAQGALLRIAYGEIGDWRAPEAANYYVNSLTNKSEARVLLAASNSKVINEGLRGLWVGGVPVDAELFERLQVIARSDSAETRGKVAKILSTDTNTALAAPKGHVIIESMRTTLQCQDASAPVITGESFFSGYWSRSDVSLGEQAQALGQIAGRTPGFSLEDIPQGPELLNDFMVLARAVAKQPSDRPDLRRVLTRSQSSYVRFLALLAFEQGPDKNVDDIAALKRMAEEDPFAAKPLAPYYFRMPGADQSLRGKGDAMIYPLRFLAEQVVKQIEANQGSSK